MTGQSNAKVCFCLWRLQEAAVKTFHISEDPQLFYLTETTDTGDDYCTVPGSICPIIETLYSYLLCMF